MKQGFNLIVTDGGAGDLICALVAVDYNIRNYPQYQFNVWVPDYLLTLAKHVLTLGAIIRPFSRAKEKFKEELPGLSTQWTSDHTPIRTHAVDYSFHMLSGRHMYRLEDKNYLQVKTDLIQLDKFKLPKNYITIMAAPAEPCKEMPKETVEAIIDFALQKNLIPVFLGSESSKAGFKDFEVKGRPMPIDYSKGINLINKTDFLEAAGIIAGGKAYVGMDGGLTHLAGFTDTEIVAGYTLADPIHVAPIRQGSQTYKFHAIEPDEGVHNRYYQTHHSGILKGDFRQFPGWRDVVATMTPEKFLTVLSSILT